MNCGKRIRDARVAAGFTQKTLAEKLGISAAQIGQYETGIRKPKVDTLNRIADAIGLSLSFFQGTQPFSDMELISKYKQVILHSLIEKGLFDLGEHPIGSVSNFSYLKAVSENIVSIIQSDIDALSIQYSNLNNNTVDSFTERVKVQTASISLDYKKQIEDLVESGYALETFFVLQDLSILNKCGIEKAKELIRDLAMNPDYQK